MTEPEREDERIYFYMTSRMAGVLLLVRLVEELTI